eukprot:CAMPEP_0181309414 /NCGR_PEP_ID=MMETSP1101-20121128/11999_1 /TAXON_ID=46948 /ORGANISM="Rhodomonas abbreviata, Strain Caron Lab Isolate" /LENGTH=46 /DNA_ID= /DNA_START= /DNA_END= /DNA_ORIENTATION=
MTQLADDGYIEYGAGDFDGQNSGHDYWGVSFHPSFHASQEFCGSNM